jgi:hypothetical protein
MRQSVSSVNGVFFPNPACTPSTIGYCARTDPRDTFENPLSPAVDAVVGFVADLGAAFRRPGMQNRSASPARAMPSRSGRQSSAITCFAPSNTALRIAIWPTGPAPQIATVSAGSERLMQLLTRPHRQSRP